MEPGHFPGSLASPPNIDPAHPIVVHFAIALLMAGAVLLLAGALAAVVAARAGTDAHGAVNDRRFDRRGDDGLRAPSPCGGAKLVDGANTASTSATEPPGDLASTREGGQGAVHATG
jgi:hypothetical protein